MSEMTPSELISLKAKVKTEMLRRGYTGSLAAYGSSTWDFTVTPVSGNTVIAEHGKKVIDPLLAVKQYGDLKTVVSGDTIPNSFDNTGLTNIVNSLATEATTTTSSSCNASCSGLCTSCSSSCNTNCSGCTGSCSGGCKGSCNGCDTTCTGGCTSCNGCSGGCSDGHCSASCSGTCDGCQGCSGGSENKSAACGGYCTGTCYTGCGGNCTGCSGSRHDV